MDAGGREIVAFLMDNADESGGENLIEDPDGRIAAGFVAVRYSAHFHVLAGAAAQLLNVRQEGLGGRSWVQTSGLLASNSAIGSSEEEMAVAPVWVRSSRARAVSSAV